MSYPSTRITKNDRTTSDALNAFIGRSSIRAEISSVFPWAMASPPDAAGIAARAGDYFGDVSIVRRHVDSSCHGRNGGAKKWPPTGRCPSPAGIWD
jgi:hypothetical protein